MLSFWKKGGGILLLLGLLPLLCLERAEGAPRAPLPGIIYSHNAAIPTKIWNPLGYGLDGTVNALTEYQNEIYAGGSFSFECDAPDCGHYRELRRGIAKWDGSGWSPVRFGLNGNVRAFAVLNDELYVGGSFTAICGNADCNEQNQIANYIAKWDGTNWSTVHFGVSGEVYALAATDSELYVGGLFKQVCGDAACANDSTKVNHIAKWNGSTWESLAYGVNEAVMALSVWGDELSVGGAFTAECESEFCNNPTTRMNGVAAWIGSQWDPLGYGLNGTVFALTFYGGTLYAGGYLFQICASVACDSVNTPTNNLVKWDGAHWTTVGYGTGAIVNALAEYEGSLYVGGNFQYLCGNISCTTNNIPIRHAARWDKTKWSRLVYGVDGPIHAFFKDDYALVTGGAFVNECTNKKCTTVKTKLNHIAAYGCTRTPARPKSQFPANGAIMSTRHPILKWKPVSCVSSYTVVVRDAQTGALLSKYTHITESQFKIGVRDKNKTYLWTVAACNQFGCKTSKPRLLTIQ